MTPDAPEPPLETTWWPRASRAISQRRGQWLAHLLVILAAAAAYAWLAPPWYFATATILPPSTDVEVSGGVAALAPGVRSVSHMVRTTSIQDMFLAILTSRTVAREVVGRFDLIRAYGVHTETDAIAVLQKHSSVVSNKEGVVAVSVEDHAPGRAADLANYLLVELDHYLKEVRATAGKGLRLFLEQRVGETRDSLAVADEALKQFELAHGPTAPSGADDAAAALLARRVELSTKLDMLLQTQSEESADVSSTRAELRAVEQSLSATPPAATEASRLRRRVKSLDQTYALLSTQLEEARSRENRDTPTVAAMDRALPPDHAARPKKGLILVTGLLLGLIESTLWVVWRARG